MLEVILSMALLGNQPPIVEPDLYGVEEDGVIVTTLLSGVLYNDSDPDSGPVPMTVVLNRDVEHGLLVLDADGTFVYTPDPDWNGIDGFVYYAYDGEDYSLSPTVASIHVYPVNEVAGRFVAYNNSIWDEYTAGIDVIRDGLAIATDKQALLPGQIATFANYTSFHRGINEIIIDVESISPANEIDANDFVFKAGNTIDPNSWNLAPAPSSIVVAQDIGVNGADRVFVSWDDGIHNQWLMVALIPRDFDLALWTEEVFFFGNLVGENTGDFQVNYDDVFDVIWPNLFTTDPVGVDHPADVNRDKMINYDDVFNIVWPNLFGSSLEEITPVHGDPVLEDRIAFSVAIGHLNAQREKERQEWFGDFASNSG